MINELNKKKGAWGEWRELQTYTVFQDVHVGIFQTWQLLNLGKHAEILVETYFRNPLPETDKTVVLTLLYFFLTEVGKNYWLCYSATYAQIGCLISREKQMSSVYQNWLSSVSKK